MKHVIVIETPDNAASFSDVEIQKEFQKRCIQALEQVCAYYVGEQFMQSRFFQNSAVQAIADMYNLTFPLDKPPST